MTRKRTFEGLGAPRCEASGIAKRRSSVNCAVATSRAGISGTKVVAAPATFAPFGSPPCRSKKQVIGQAMYQQKRIQQVLSTEYVDFGDMVNVCPYCSALFWTNESIQVPKNSPFVYTTCCHQGRVELPHCLPTPPLLDSLLNPKKGPKSTAFRKNIRAYNTVFAFTSFGADIDRTVNDGYGPYVFKICGQVCHLMGTLLPPEGQSPKFAQLYIYMMLKTRLLGPHTTETFIVHYVAPPAIEIAHTVISTIAQMREQYVLASPSINANVMDNIA